MNYKDHGKHRPSPRLILSAALIVLKLSAIIAALMTLYLYLPPVRIAARAISLICAVKIIASPDNPDYKLPWLFIIMIAPTLGFMLYLLLYSRILPIGYIKRLARILPLADLSPDDSQAFAALKESDPVAYTQARLLCSASGAHLYRGTHIKYFPSGEQMLTYLLTDIKRARSFIYLEYYIISPGHFLKLLTDALAERAAAGVDVRILYDDFGCIDTLPESFRRDMAAIGISAVPFSRIRGCLDVGFHNRNHRKLTVIDGEIAYTGGVNIGDEYIGIGSRLGRWKDSATRLDGPAVQELLRLFIIDHGVNSPDPPSRSAPIDTSAPLNDRGARTEQKDTVAPPSSCEKRSGSPIKGRNSSARGKTPLPIRLARLPMDALNAARYRDPEYGFCIPFGDGPRPLYSSRAAKSLIIAMLGCASQSVYITTPYLVIDSELLGALKVCAGRGVDVRIILPEIPDKRFVRLVTDGLMLRLIEMGVKVYLYSDGFIHAKTYIADGKYAMIGTVNLDNRSLCHNFECGVWLYGTDRIRDICADFSDTLLASRQLYKSNLHRPWHKRIACAILGFFSPLF